METVFEKYGYRNNSGGGGLHLSGTDPQEVGTELERIRTLHDGKLYPSDVIEGAKPKSSPLHPIFEWNDTEASRRYRMYQARCLIKTVVVTFKSEEKASKPKPVFVNVISKEEVKSSDPVERAEILSDQHYTTRTNAMKTPMFRDHMVRNALSELRSWKRRYEDFNEFSLIFSAIEATEVKLKR
ncbi:MAG: hypothetical protein WC455_25005 [Dehalococcoidia bacterium]|jgi:hypothetical protein